MLGIAEAAVVAADVDEEGASGSFASGNKMVRAAFVAAFSNCKGFGNCPNAASMKYAHRVVSLLVSPG